MRGATPLLVVGRLRDLFQSTLLMRGATRVRKSGTIYAVLFQSTLLMRGATNFIRRAFSLRCYFNPRSSCEERQHSSQTFYLQSQFQSTLLMRGATATGSVFSTHSRFQSTLLMRGATRHCSLRPSRGRYFNPRSSCEERRQPYRAKSGTKSISIHAPHARSDPSLLIIALFVNISIHAPHARSD